MFSRCAAAYQQFKAMIGSQHLDTYFIRNRATAVASGCKKTKNKKKSQADKVIFAGKVEVRCASGRLWKSHEHKQAEFSWHHSATNPLSPRRDAADGGETRPINQAGCWDSGGNMVASMFQINLCHRFAQCLRWDGITRRRLGRVAGLRGGQGGRRDPPRWGSGYFS